MSNMKLRRGRLSRGRPRRPTVLEDQDSRVGQRFSTPRWASAIDSNLRPILVGSAGPRFSGGHPMSQKSRSTMPAPGTRSTRRSADRSRWSQSHALHGPVPVQVVRPPQLQGTDPGLCFPASSACPALRFRKGPHFVPLVGRRRLPSPIAACVAGQPTLGIPPLRP